MRVIEIKCNYFVIFQINKGYDISLRYQIKNPPGINDRYKRKSIIL